MNKTIKDILDRYIKQDSTLIVGFSGGSDSVFLLHQLLLYKENVAFTIVLAHFNHLLRGKESNEDEEFCRNEARKNDLQFESMSAKIQKIAQKNRLSIEEAGRIHRYAFFKKMQKKYNADFILTAHHLNDDLETFFLNFLRGTALRGLQGMHIKNKNILRPLLTTPKSEILSYLKKNTIQFRTDSTNSDKSHKRNKIRHDIIPKLLEIQPELLSIYRRNHEHFAEINSYFEEKSKSWIKKNESNNAEFPLATVYKTPSIIQKSILQYIYEDRYGSTEGLNSATIDRALSLISHGKTGKKTEFGTEYELVINDKTFQILPIKKTKPIKKQKIAIPGKTLFSYGEIASEITEKSPKKLNSALHIDHGKVKLPLYIRKKLPGDRYNPLGLKGRKKVKDYFIDKKIPAHKRSQIPVFIDSDGKIIAVGQNQIDDNVKVTKNTKKIISITVNALENNEKRSKL